MKEKINLLLKGTLIGIANIIPGVSGGTMAISLGLYEKIIGIVADFKKNIKQNILFLLPIGLGAIFSLVLFSNVINFALENYKFITILVFVGLILGGVPTILKKIENKKSYKNIIPFLIVVIFMLSLSFIKTNAVISFLEMEVLQYFLLVVVGIIAAITMVVPGISGSLVLMLIGYYKPILEVIKELTEFQNVFHNLLIIFLLGIGIITGIIGSSKLIKKSLEKFRSQTYSAVLGFVISSVILMFTATSFSTNFTEILIGLVLMTLCMLLTYKLEK